MASTLLEPLKRPPNLFWSASLASDSDFTAEDPLALDYLAQQVGLWLFRGITTRTRRAQNYVVVLYGLHLADRAIQERGYPGDDGTRTRLFERWERFWALATLEYRDGILKAGDPDAMRGMRGALRAWFPGSKPLPLDFPLISRQSELGGLGAYLTSLRECGLVFPASLRVTPAANSLLAAFWREPGAHDTRATYDAYALKALNLDAKTVSRNHGHLTLGGVGRRTRLSVLTARKRTAQQDRLWQALFLAARDGSTLPLAHQLIAAHTDAVTNPRALLEGFVAGRWGALPDDVQRKVELALAFGHLARALLERFNRAYAHVDTHGWVADIDDVARAAFPVDEAAQLRITGQAVLQAAEHGRFGKLQFHGPQFLTLLRKLADAPPTEALEHLLAYHRSVQRSRRGGGAWLRSEQRKLVMQVAGYNGYKSEPSFPSLKLDAVRQLLADLGRIA